MDFSAMRIAPHSDEFNTRLQAITNIDEYNNSYIYSNVKSAKAKAAFTWNPMDDEWRDNCLESQWWAQSTFEEASKFFDPQRPLSRKLFDIRDKLLSFGGEMACMPAFPDADTDYIIKYGQFWLGKNHKMMRGLPSQCHYNACSLWLENKDNTRICTGFALSKDGMWREHSWLVQYRPSSNIIVETTVPRVAYFGYVMTKEQCEAFVEDCW